MFDPQNLKLPSEFRGEVRLFPLPKLVVFPGNIQPLRIFEPRYCDMLKQALETNRLITMATLRAPEKGERTDRPPIAPAVCVCRIIANQQNDDQTHDVFIIGLARACIEREWPLTRPFREATVSILQEEEPADSPATDQLRRRLHDELLSLPYFHQQGVIPAIDELPLGLMTDILAFRLPLTVSFKLRLLAEPNAVRRGNALFKALNSDGGSRSGSDMPPFSIN